MNVRRKKRRNKEKRHKLIILCMIFFVSLIVYVTIPTLSSYKNRNLSQSITVWSGAVANSYRSGNGTLEDPYVIANGEELAYFASQLKTTSYEGEYFILSNNIVLNEGIFSYNKNDGIKYKKDNVENIITPSIENDIINEFEHLNGFKGTFNGNYYSIYGLYIDDYIEDGQNALFTNLEGNIKNLYIENSIIYDGKITAGVASKSKNSTITNVLYDGYVISSKENTNDTTKLELEDISLNIKDLEFNDNINITDLEYIPGLITEVILTGNYSSNNPNGILKINNEEISVGDFEISLGDKISKTIPINYQTNTESNISLTNLKYQVKYTYSNAAGIVSNAQNTTIKNTINKAYINGRVYSSGIVNFVSETTVLKNIYNTGKIESDNISSGLISNINNNQKNTTVINCYNIGELNSTTNSMIGNIENNIGNITLENIFNPQDTYAINLVEESNVSINNSYSITDKFIKSGTSNGEFIKTTKESLEDKTFILNELQYEEFNEDENSENLVWIFEDNSLPKLFIDYKIANISIGEYKWDEYKNTLNTLKFSKKFVVSIKESNELNTIKEMYYYISNKENSLSKNELNEITNWIKYENIVEIDADGIYTIYAKIINNDDSVLYLNTDLIMLDTTKANATISTSLEDISWDTLKDDLNNYYIDEEISVTINANDQLSGIKDVYYYTTDKLLTKEELENLENWNEYQESILITNKKTIIYAKVIDNCDNVTYINSDYIIKNGYILNSLYPGMSKDATENLYITPKSSVSLNFSYQDAIEYEIGNKHQIISNILLPQNTIITIIDKINNKVYKYTTTNDNYGYDENLDNTKEAIYDFELFNEVGTTNKFQETNYTGMINEKFIINIDFKNTKIENNLENILISLRLFNEEESKIKNTLQSTKKKFNINTDNSEAYFTLTSLFKDTIKYSENEKYIIDLNSKLNYKYLDNNKIYDTTFEDKNIGLEIKMISPNEEVVEKKYLKNISFLLDDKKYSPSSDGIVRINLENITNNITKNLTIQTFMDNSKLKSGDYKFVISLYTAYDGLYSNEILTNIEIPVYVGENAYKNDVNFNVIMDNEDKIITTDTNEFNFNFLISDNLKENSNIRISLYKKNELSAYDQNYAIIDLGDYLVDGIYEKHDDNIYYASKNVKNNDALNINLNASLLEKNGYMFIFELVENDKVVSKINKKFIVK